MEYFYFATKIILSIYFLYIAIRPEKLNIRKFSRQQVRIVAIIFVIFNTFFIGHKIYSNYTAPSVKAEADKNPIVEKVKARLEKYSEEAKTNSWAKACTQENVKVMKSLGAQLSDEGIHLVALHACACSYENLKGTEGFDKSFKLIESGKDYATALNESFTNMQEFENKVMPCTDIN